MWQSNDRGLALILVVSVLAIAAIMAISFVFTMRLELRAAVNFQDSLKAGYLAEAGIAHARAVLKTEKLANSFDTDGDSWRTTFWGDAMDNNEDGSADSRWLEVQDSSSQVIGRYAVLIEDEAGKVNINMAGRHNMSPLKVTEGWTPYEVSLERFLSQFGLAGLAEGIINYRYGQDGVPGIEGVDDDNDRWLLENDGIDNDADGDIDEPQEGIDEPDEFNPDLPLGDDRPFLTSEGVKKVEGFAATEFGRIKNFITAYSLDKEVSSGGELKYNLNTSNPDSLLALFLEAGVGNPWQKAVNITDFVDIDDSPSRVTKYSRRSYVDNVGPQGDWTWQSDHYENTNPGGAGGGWSWGINIPEGEYFLFIYGSQGAQHVGNVTIDSRTKEHMRDGDQFGKVNLKKGWLIFPELCGLTINIQNNEAPGATCFFKSFELVPVSPTPGFPSVEVQGAEAIRINELMVRPLIRREVTLEQNPGGDWVWTGSSFQNGNPGGGITGEGNWVFSGIPDGEYYLTVYGESEAQDIGDVKVEGIWQDRMDHQDRFTRRQTVTVSGGRFYISIQNNEQEGVVCYFKSIELSQQPDAEYIELVNISPRSIDLSGWSIEGPGPDGWPAFIPPISLGPYRYLVLSVDKDDTCSGINGNGISLRDIWGSVDSVQLNFSKEIDPLSDPLKDSPLPNENFLILKDTQGHIVDKVEYTAGQIQDYRSLERGDPTFQEDRDNNGEFDGWVISGDLTGGTPGNINNNSSMRQTDEQTGEVIQHNIEEVGIFNTPLATIADSTKISDGSPWRKICLDDLVRLSDKVTVHGKRLEAEGANIITGWSEVGRATPLTNWFISTTLGQEGSWLWTGLKNGRYILSIYGQEEEGVSISIHLADGSWTPGTPSLIPGSSNAVFYGIVEIGTGTNTSTPAGRLEISLRNNSLSGTAHFDYIQLSPLVNILGRININTAPLEVLMALPGIDSDTAQRIITNHPYGNRDGLNKGIGDILLGDVLGETEEERKLKFKPISNLITVRSDVYRVIATGQVLENGRVIAEKRIWAVVER